MFPGSSVNRFPGNNVPQFLDKSVALCRDKLRDKSVIMFPHNSAGMIPKMIKVHKEIEN